jgi:hypothetical protein
LPHWRFSFLPRWVPSGACLGSFTSWPVRSGFRRPSQDLPRHSLAVREDSIQLKSYEGPRRESEKPKWKPIPDLVPNHGSARRFLERMSVNPLLVRASNLFIDEAVRRTPGGDQRPPANGDSEQPEPVVDERSGPHVDRQRRQNPKPQLRWRDSLEVSGVGKEIEHLRDRTRDGHFQGYNRHETMDLPQ